MQSVSKAIRQRIQTGKQDKLSDKHLGRHKCIQSLRL